MERSFELLDNATCDLLVIGGGINGSACAWDAAQRGFSVILVEKGDFGSGTSAGCFRIIHGGARYLQHLDFPRILESGREQKFLRKAAPHLMRPLSFVLPCYGRGLKRRFFVNMGFWIYDLITLFRNTGIARFQHLPFHEKVSADELKRDFPEISTKNLEGGVRYSDCQMANCDRAVLAVIQSAVDAGARVCNYASVEGALLNDDATSVKKIVIRDCLSGKKAEVKPSFVLNATGPWVQELNETLMGVKKSNAFSRVWSKGVQVVLDMKIPEAIAIESDYKDDAIISSRRMLFLLPWHEDLTLLGTSDSEYYGSPEDFHISEEEIHTLLGDAKKVLNRPELSYENVLYAFGGLRLIDQSALDKNDRKQGDALVARSGKLTFHSDLLSSDPLKVDNLCSLEEVKYTTFRLHAERAINAIEKRLKGTTTPCKTKSSFLWGGNCGTLMSEKIDRADNPLELYLLSRYGDQIEKVRSILEMDEAFSLVVQEGMPLLIGEVIYFFKSEMAQHLTDVLFRRTNVGMRTAFTEDLLRNFCNTCGTLLGWEEKRIQKEHELVVKEYKRMGINS